ncbi:MAG: UrcA family protein [Asticcacaulis sp.]
MRKIVSMFVVVAALGVSGAAMAGENTPERSVRFTQADLNDPAQAKEVLKRIKAAAREVCDEGLSSPHGLIITDRQCEMLAVEEAVADIGHPMLYAAQSDDLSKRGVKMARTSREAMRVAAK